MPNYQKGKIYRLVNSVNEIEYIGSTVRGLSARMAEHRSKARAGERSTYICQAMRDIGIDTFRILFIKDFPCTSKAELEAEEFAVMKKCETDGIVLYNSVIDGKLLPELCDKISKRNTGYRLSESTKQKLSAAHTKRGSVSYDKCRPRWRFNWTEGGVKHSQGFSVKKYTYDGAHGLALMAQDRKFPTVRE